MATNLATLKKRIAKLQAQADELEAQKASEVKGVIERMKVAIAHYDLQPDDLFGSKASARGKKPDSASKGKALAKKAAFKKAASKKAPASIKFSDGAGNSWTGHGRRPRWYVEAIEAGKTPDDLLVK